MKLTAVVTTILFTSFSVVGCYNTYDIKKDEFEKLQRKPDDSALVTVKDDEGRNVVVDEGTRLYVRSTGGRRYPVTAFNFRLTESQLVASDRDTLLAIDGIAEYEVDHLSVWKTVGLAGVGAAAAAGVIFAIIFTAGSKTFGD